METGPISEHSRAREPFVVIHSRNTTKFGGLFHFQEHGAQIKSNIVKSLVHLKVKSFPVDSLHSSILPGSTFNNCFLS